MMFIQLRSQLDHRAIEDLETVEGLLGIDAQGRVVFKSDYHDHLYAATMQERLMEVWTPEGALLYRNEVLGSRVMGGKPTAGEGIDSYSAHSVRLADGTPVRLVSKTSLA